MKSLSQLVSKVVQQRPTIDGHFVENFDGLRAVAALMVMSMHMKTIPDLAAAAPGVLLFFALSGYLLYSGFISFTQQVNSKIIFAYLARRVFRILPLYLFFAFVYGYLFKGWSLDAKNTFFLVQAFFLKGTLHLWTVRVEMILYLILPFIIIALSFVRTSLTRSMMLISFSILFVYLFHVHRWSIPGIHDFIAIFMLGMAAVHLRELIPVKLAPFVAYMTLAVILLLSTFSPWNSSLREFFGIYNRSDMFTYSHVFYPLCFLLLLSLSRFRSSFWGNQWLRLIGVCGYGFYLWHPMIIEMVRRWHLTGFLYQFSAYALTLGLAITTYLVIEKPGIKVGRQVSSWIRRDNKLLPGLRPWWVCIMVVMAFFSYRQIYLLDKSMQFQIIIWSSEDTTARIYLANRGNFSEKAANSANIRANQWQKITIPLDERRIGKIRFDPGEITGEYRIKEFTLKFPLSKKVFSLDLESFEAFNDVKSVEFQDSYLAIVTEPEAKDPILIYQGQNPGTLLSIRNMLNIMAIFGSFFLLLIFTMLDRMEINMSERKVSI